MLVVQAGCGGGGSTAKVSGKVTTGGKPVTGASICFSSQGGASCGVLDDTGEYEITIGLKPGSYKVYLFVPSTPGSPPMPKEPPATEPTSNVPPKYLSVTSSGLTAEVRAGDNPNTDFALD
jgi:hypothetical protein